MRHIDNWDDIEERRDGGFQLPPPGGYIARVTAVADDERKECLKLNWDYAAPPWAGFNAQTFRRAGFWPTALFRSYKESALGFFKAFKTAVEQSNPGYTFDDRDPPGLRDKLIGVVLGEELYIAKSGEKRKRLYVAQVRSVQAIREGDYTLPPLRDKTGGVPSADPFAELDGGLPWNE